MEKSGKIYSIISAVLVSKAFAVFFDFETLFLLLYTTIKMIIAQFVVSWAETCIGWASSFVN